MQRPARLHLVLAGLSLQGLTSTCLFVDWHPIPGSLHAASRSTLRCCERTSLVTSHQSNMSSSTCQHSRHQCSSAWVWRMSVYRVPLASKGALTSYKLKMTLRGLGPLPLIHALLPYSDRVNFGTTCIAAAPWVAALMSLMPEPGHESPCSTGLQPSWHVNCTVARYGALNADGKGSTSQWAESTEALCAACKAIQKHRSGPGAEECRPKVHRRNST